MNGTGVAREEYRRSDACDESPARGTPRPGSPCAIFGLMNRLRRVRDAYVDTVLADRDADAQVARRALDS